MTIARFVWTVVLVAAAFAALLFVAVPLAVHAKQGKYPISGLPRSTLSVAPTPEAASSAGGDCVFPAAFPCGL